MAKSSKKSAVVDDEMEAEYDFKTMKNVERGKYAKRFSKMTRFVLLADDVADAFRTDEQVNAALRKALNKNKPKRRSA